MKGEHLFLAAREALFTVGSPLCVIKTLDAAIAAFGGGGSGENAEEARWLRDVLGERNYVCSDLHNRLILLIEDIVSIAGPRACYYRGRSLIAIYCFSEGFSQLKLAANDGNTAAAGELWKYNPDVNNRQHGDPNGVYYSAQKCVSHARRLELLRRAALAGLPAAMTKLIREFAHQLSDIECVIFAARRVLFSAGNNGFIPNLVPSLNRSYYFYIGRELQDYKKLWKDDEDLSNDEWQACVSYYHAVTAMARRAALQTGFVLRPLCGRDVARMIAQMVYKTRYTDTKAWSVPNLLNDVD
jgi:hypothetical protein